MITEKLCKKCNRVLPADMFWKDKTHADGLRTMCRECSIPYTKTYYDSNKDKWQNRQKRNQQIVEDAKTDCVKCGDKRRYLIQFHHVNPDDKLFDSLSWGTRAEKALREELNKCVCLCANCHTEFHYLYGKTPQNPEEKLNEYLAQEVSA